MRLKTSVTLFVALVLGLFAALSISLVRTAHLLDRSGMDLAIASESIRLAQELNSSLLTHNRNAFLYELHRDPQRMASRVAERAAIVELLETMSLLTSDQAEAAMLTELTEAVERYFIARRQLSALPISATEQYERISENVDETIAIVDKLIDINRTQMRFLVSSIERQNENAIKTAVVLLSIGGITLGGLIAAVFAFAARPLSRLTRVVAKYGRGNRTVRAKPRGLQEIQEIASNFNSMADRLEERRQDQLRVIASIAHDLRNPLNSIALVSELLVQKSTEQDRELADVVLRQVNNLDNLVQDLLDTSRMEAGQLELHFAENDLKATINDAVELQRGGTEFHRLVLDLPDEAMICRYDSARLSQVLNNLLSNAVKYSPNGGTITVKAIKEADRIRVSVSDQGIGIPPEDLDNVFKPFHRTAITKGVIPGIGLGLSASRRIVEAHGGTLSVESTLGKGSTFHLDLPREGPAVCE